MPTLHLRGVSPELLARLRAGARLRDQPLDTYALNTLQHGQDAREARSSGGHARSVTMTTQQRQDAARTAARARWATRTETPPE